MYFDQIPPVVSKIKRRERIKLLSVKPNMESTGPLEECCAFFTVEVEAKGLNVDAQLVENVDVTWRTPSSLQASDERPRNDQIYKTNLYSLSYNSHVSLVGSGDATLSVYKTKLNVRSSKVKCVSS